MSPGIRSVQALPWFHCLWTEMNFSDPCKCLQALRYFRNAEKRNTHAGETELQVTLNHWCQRDFYSQGGEELIPLWLTPHTLSQLWEMSQNKRKIQIQHRKSIIWQFSYNSSLLGLTQRKEKILKDWVNRKQNIFFFKIYTMYWSDSRDITQTRNVTEVKTSCSNRSSH